MIPPWLAPSLASIATLRERMPHALLIHGQAGVGKRQLARSIACALLCEAADENPRPDAGCGICPACLWFDQGNHPDFRRLTSEAIAALEGSADPDPAGDDADDQDDSTPRSKKAPSKEIKVEQIRALQRFLSVATHRGRARVVLLHPFEAVNEVGANALLKMLEEPPPHTVFILLADAIGRVPATILSRCRKVPVATPSAAQAASWLGEHGIAEPADLLALAGGAPFAALDLAKAVDRLAQHRELVDYLSAPGVERAMAAAESFARTATAPLVRGLQLWLADCITMRLAGRIRYHPAQSKVIARLAGTARLDALLGLAERLVAVRRTVDHPLNLRLLMEGLLVAYAETMSPARP